MVTSNQFRFKPNSDSSACRWPQVLGDLLLFSPTQLAQVKMSDEIILAGHKTKIKEQYRKDPKFLDIKVRANNIALD